jgi:hypothetical protein
VPAGDLALLTLANSSKLKAERRFAGARSRQNRTFREKLRGAQLLSAFSFELSAVSERAQRRIARYFFTDAF